MSWHLIVCCLALLLFCSPCLASELYECHVNISEGVPWTVGDTTYNFADLQVSTLSNLITPPYTVDVGTTPNGSLTSSNGWNSTTQTADGFWDALYINNPVAFGAVYSHHGDQSADISYVDVAGTSCDMGVSSTIEPVGATEAGLSFVSVQNGVLLGNDGQPLTLRGINWFGFEEPGNQMVDGLWFGTDSISKDFATIVYRLQLLGFNAVRLPMNFQNLYNLSPSEVTQACNVDSQRTIADSTKDPSSSVDAGGAPSQIDAPTQTPGQCNG